MASRTVATGSAEDRCVRAPLRCARAALRCVRAPLRCVRAPLRCVRAPLGRRLLVQAALTAAYFCSGKIGLAYAVVQANATAIWPPTGIGMAAAMALGPRV